MKGKVDRYDILYNNVKDISENCPGFGDYYTLLGGRRGYCFGLVFMWGQAVLVGPEEENRFHERLRLMTLPFSESFPLSRYINNLANVRKQCVM